MRAVVLQAHGEPESALVERVDVPEPELAAGEVLVRVRATSVNRVDCLLRRGYPGLTLQLPHILGGDIVGEVVALGRGITSLKEGDRVVVYPLLSCGTCSLCRRGLEHLCTHWQFIGMHRAGGYAEYVAIPERCCIPLPASIADTDAACLGVAGLTAYHALEVAGIGADDRVLVWGATGGMGSFLIKLARYRGARVIATTRTPAHHAELLSSWGAEWVLPTIPPEATAQALRERFPEGIDAVIDSIGSATFPASLSVLRKGGRLVFCGILTGREVPFNLHQAYLRHLSLHGIYLGTKAELHQLVQLTARGELHPAIAGVYPLSEAAVAHRMLEHSGVGGKLVLIP